jgi:hypothetical protein
LLECRKRTEKARVKENFCQHSSNKAISPLTNNQEGEFSMARPIKSYIPTNGPEDWKNLLAQPEKHWRTGHSANALAHCWEDAYGFPERVDSWFTMPSKVITLSKHIDVIGMVKRSSKIHYTYDGKVLDVRAVAVLFTPDTLTALGSLPSVALSSEGYL